MEPTFFQHFLGLLQNAALLVLGVLAYAWARGPLSRWPGLPREGVEGAIFAALVWVCMTAPMWLSPGVRIDARNALVAVATVFAGPLAGLAAVAAAVGYRLWLGGIGAPGGAAIAAAVYVVTLLYMRWMRRSAPSFDGRHLAILALAIGVIMVVGLAAEPTAVAIEVLQKAGIPGLTIVPGAVLVLGGIVLRFDRSRAAERAVAESEARLRSIINHLPQPLAIKDREDRLLLTNSAYERATGHSAQELAGQRASQFWDKFPGLAVMGELQQRVWRTGEPQTSPPHSVSGGDRDFSVVVSSFPIRQPDGSFDAIGTILSDVTHLLRAKQQREQREVMLRRQQQALLDIVRVHPGPERSITEAVRSTTEIVGTAIDSDECAIFLIDRQDAVARCVDDWTRATGHHGIRPDAELQSFGDLIADIEQHRVVAIEDALDDPRLAPRRAIMEARGIRSLMIPGVYLGAQLAGYVVFGSLEKQRVWTVEEMAFARSVADLLALMLLASRHREALAALDLVRDAIYVEREDGHLIYANRPALALAGGEEAPHLAGNALPRPTRPLLGEHDVEEVAWPIAGAHRDLEVRRSRLPGGGVVTVINDVTDRKVEQRDRERLQLHLQQASKMEAIGQLAGGIAHDFNNLLGAVIGFARFLEQDLPANTPQRLFAQRILGACNRGKDLVAQILSFTRARALERHQLDLRAVLAEARELLAGSLPATTRLVAELGDMPFVVKGNEAQLQQVAVNLCLNAHDALGGRPGEIRISLASVPPRADAFRRPMVVGQLDPGRRYVRLEVADTGAGIPAENVSRIFEPFFTTKERGRGTGLGLAVVHGIVTTYEGACSVESRAGQGTRFSIYLPLIEGIAAEPTHGDERPDLRGRERVLIVDDETDITDMMSIGLERLGYEVAALNDPAEALQTFAEEPDAWDAVITDQLMPGMQGLALAEKLKAIRPGVTVILCTGLDDGTIGRSALAQGVDAFFTKPVEPEQIAASIRDLSGH